MTKQWSEICDRFCGRSISKYMSSCFSPDETDTPAPPKKDNWFLYFTTPNLICRLNIDEFCKTSSESMPLQFECLYEVKHNYRRGDDDEDGCEGDHHPCGISLYGTHTLVGSKLYISVISYDRGSGYPVTYCFDPTDPDGPSFCRCDEGSIPEVVSYTGNNRVLYVPVNVDADYASIEFNGFLIGVPRDRFGTRLVAYRWDSNGVRRLYRVLHELDEIFCPFLDSGYFSMGKCDGGRMWLVYLGKDVTESRCTRVAVFRVSVANDSAGNPIISADLEAAEFFQFHWGFVDCISSAFALCHQPNGDEDNKNLCGTIIGHARC